MTFIEGRKTTLNIALPGSVFLYFIIDRYTLPQTALTISLLGGLYLAMIMDLYGRPKLPLIKPCLEVSS
jgi:hypothetical protein